MNTLREMKMQKKQNGEFVRLSVNLSSEMHSQIRIVAALENRSVSDITREIWQKFIKKRTKKNQVLAVHIR